MSALYHVRIPATNVLTPSGRKCPKHLKNGGCKSRDFYYSFTERSSRGIIYSSGYYSTL